MSARPKRGDVQTDPDGSRWIVLGVEVVTGAVKVSRIRVGSLAARVLGFGHIT